MEFKLKSFKKVISVTKMANIHYFEFTKQYHTFRDKHSFRELVYVDSGFITVDAENYTGILKENELLIHKADEIHSLSCPENDVANVIIIGFECNACELDCFSQSPVILTDSQKKLLTEIVKEGRNVFLPPYDIPNQKDMKKRSDCPFGADQMLKLKLEIFFIELIRGYMNVEKEENIELSDDKIQEICRYLNENYKQKIRLSELCFLFGTNKTTLCSKFRSSCGMTLISYVNRLKIKEAKRLLRQGNHNLTEISALLGFSSVHYFSHTFKQYENQAPTNYIKTIKSKLMM